MKIIAPIVCGAWCLICYLAGVAVGERRARRDHDMTGAGCKWEEIVFEMKMELGELCESPAQNTREIAKYLLRLLNEIEKRNQK